jgi:hypothetical protein
MIKLRSIFAIFALSMLGFGVQSCTNRDSEAENAAEEITEGSSEAIEDFGDLLEDAGDDIEDAADEPLNK